MAGKTEAQVRRVTAEERPKDQILIVDDESVVCDIVSDILVEDGFVCHRAYTANDALQLLSRFSCQCLVSDIRMPGMDGLELLNKARALDPDLEVILMTGLADASSAITALRAGASNYIMKPFDTEDIRHGVRRAIEHRQLILEKRQYQSNLETKLAEQAETIRHQFLCAIQSLAKAVEARDPYTHGHSDRVGNLARNVAKDIGLSSRECDLVHLAGLLHDIGKIGIPDEILQKRGPLEPHEWQIMKTHPVIGCEIVKQIDPPQILIDGILYHHEYWDGRGYPIGRAGNVIPVVGRILAVTDAYDAMTSARPYRDAFSKNKAMQRIADSRGKQFDPELADVVLKVLEDNSIEIRNANGQSNGEKLPSYILTA